MSTDSCIYIDYGWRTLERQTMAEWPKSVNTGLGYGLGWTSALFVTHSVDEAAYAACGAIKVLNLCIYFRVKTFLEVLIVCNFRIVCYCHFYCCRCYS